MSATRSAAHLDPRSPFVLDTRELGRRPGSMRRVRITVAAPADWALDLVRVPTGADVDLDLRLEAVMDGVLVSGTVHGPIVAECGRCLDPVETAFDADVQELYAYDAADVADDDEAQVLDGDLLDLQPVLRDAVVLGFPINPVCADDCAGLCTTCGERLADLEPDHSHDIADPRWAALSALHDSSEHSTPAGSPEIGR
jgi:uncharacterized protein